MKKVILIAMAVLFIATLAWAGTRVVKDKMKYTAEVEYTGTVTHSAAVNFAGVATYTKAIYRSGTSPTATATVGYSIAGTEGDLFLIDAQPPGIALQKCGDGEGPSDDAGVTVVLPTPTAALNGWEPTFVKADSGATDIFLYAGGSAIDSGTTDNKALDAQYDWVTVQCYYVTSSTKGYVIKGYGNK